MPTLRSTLYPCVPAHVCMYVRDTALTFAEYKKDTTETHTFFFIFRNV